MTAENTRARVTLAVAAYMICAFAVLFFPRASLALQQPTMYAPYCMSGGYQVQLTWSRVSGASNYPLRVDGAGYCAGNVSGPGNWGCYQGVEYLYETAYSGIVLSIVPNTSYTWWVHGQNGGAWSPATALSFSCSPPPPSCTAQYSCSGNYQTYQSRDCSTSYIQYCSYGCSNGSCNAPPTASCSVSFDTNPITAGSGTYLRWSSTNANSWVYISNIGYVGASGATWVAPSSSTDYSCLAYGSGGTDGWHSATLSVSAPAPTEPSTSASCSSNGDVNISWGNSSGASYYALRVNNTNTSCGGVSGPNNNVGCVSGTDYVEDNIPTYIQSRTVTSVPGGSPVTYWVHGVSSSGWSTGTQRSITCTPTPPPEPTGQTYTCSADGTSVTMSWNAVDAPNLFGYPLRLDDTTVNGCSIGPYYHSWYCAAANNAPTELEIDWQAPYQNYMITATSHTAPVVPGRTYRWWVHSLTHVSGSVDYWWSSTTPHTFTCAPAPACTLTTGVAVVTASIKYAYWGSNAVTFAWTTQNANTFSIYPAPTTMWMTPVSSGWWTYGPINQTTTFTGTATNGSGVGGTCTATVIVPTEPVGYSHTCSADGTQATLSWGTSSGATSYALRVDNRSVGSACNGITGVPNNKNGGCWQQYWPYSSAYGYTGNPGYTDYIEDNIPLSTHTKTVTISPAGSPVTWWVSGVSPHNPPFTGYTYDSNTYLGYAYSDWTFTTFTCPVPPPTCSVTFDRNPVAYGSGGTILRWSVADGSKIFISGAGWIQGTSGSFSVNPSVTTDYWCQGWSTGYGSGTAQSAVLTVTPPLAPTVTISANPPTITVGESSTVTATYAAGTGDTLTANNIDSPLGTGLGANSNPTASKSITFTPNGPGTYTFYARATSQYFTSWTTYRTATVTVNPSNPTCTLSLNPTTITRGGSSTLSWTSTNSSGGTISPTVGVVGPNGSTQVSPTQSTTYTGVFNGSGNSARECNNGTGVTFTVNCPISYSCSGDTIVRTNADCSTTSLTPSCTAPSFCSPGVAQCLYPPIAFVSFTDSSGFYDDGHLHARPQLVPSNDPTKLYWKVENVSSCSVTGTNGDSWSVADSGASGRTSSPITQQTTFTLTCQGLPGADPASVTESVVVDIAPIFEEN